MSDRDFSKSFVFHNMEWVDDILHMSDLGLWNMITDPDMQIGRASCRERV